MDSSVCLLLDHQHRTNWRMFPWIDNVSLAHVVLYVYSLIDVTRACFGSCWRTSMKTRRRARCTWQTCSSKWRPRWTLTHCRWVCGTSGGTRHGDVTRAADVWSLRSRRSLGKILAPAFTTDRRQTVRGRIQFAAVMHPYTSAPRTWPYPGVVGHRSTLWLHCKGTFF